MVNMANAYGSFEHLLISFLIPFCKWHPCFILKVKALHSEKKDVGEQIYIC